VLLNDSTIAGVGYRTGKPERLIAAYDSSKMACGIDYPGFNYLYYVFPYTNTMNRTFCVSECPFYLDLATAPTTLNCQVNDVINSCDANCGFLTALQEGTVTLPPDESLFDISTFVCIFNTTVCNSIYLNYYRILKGMRSCIVVDFIRDVIRILG
jgi:hypothetical protein